MKTISISNRKGGTGKTTISYNLAHILADKKHKTLLLDMDSQSSLTNIINKPFSKGMYQVLSGECSITEATLEVNEYLHFVPTSDELENIDIQFVNIEGREQLLKQALETIKGRYDYVIIDNSPATNLALINSLVASDKVICPVNADYMSFDGFQKFRAVIEQIKQNLNEDLEFAGVVVNSTRNSKHSREIEAALESYNTLATLSMSVVMMDSMVENKPLFVYAYNHPNREQLEELYRRVIK